MATKSPMEQINELKTVLDNTRKELTVALENARQWQNDAKYQSDLLSLTRYELEAERTAHEATRKERDAMREALQIYADKDNWNTAATTDVESGEPENEDGYSPMKTVELELGLLVVWNYDDDGTSVARSALALSPAAPAQATVQEGE